jgi:hypothetical protein
MARNVGPEDRVVRIVVDTSIQEQPYSTTDDRAGL